MMIKHKINHLVLSLIVIFSSILLFATEVGTNKLKSGVVRIKPKTGDQGSGFIVKLSKDVIYIITAKHVVNGDDNPQVEFYSDHNGRTHQPTLSKLIGKDTENDIAILKIEGEKNFPEIEHLFAFPLVPFDLKERDEIEIIGIPSKIDKWIIADGKIIQVGTKIFFTGFVELGISGGPLVKEDRAVGLIIDSAGASLGGAIPASQILLFLQDNEIKIP